MQESLIQVIHRTVFLKQPLEPSGLVFLRPDGVQLEFCQVESHLSGTIFVHRRGIQQLIQLPAEPDNFCRWDIFTGRTAELFRVGD